MAETGDKHDSGLLKEVSAIVSGALLTIWSTDGRKLVSIERGEDRILEAFLGAGRMLCWSSDSGHEYLKVHDDTTWIWVVRAAEGHSTTVRCYKERPILAPMLRCRRGHLLAKHMGASSIFRWGVTKHQCCRCGEALRDGTLRWVCKVCHLDHCPDCAEGETWAQAMSPGQTTDVGCVQSIEDFVLPVKAAAGAKAPDAAATVDDWLTAPIDVALVASEKTRAPIKRRKSEIERANSLTAIPYLGARSMGRIQNETMDRLSRCLQHGDVHGAWRTLARARILAIDEQELEESAEALKQLESEGEFALLLMQYRGE